MTYELAKELKDAGFPHITRWEVENNYRRTPSATGQESLPPLGALLSEIGRPALWLDEINGELVWLADNALDTGIREEHYSDNEINRANGYAGKPFLTGYIDTSPSNNISRGSTPEEAVARLWLALKKGG